TIEELVDKDKGIAVQNTKMGDQVLSKIIVTKDKVTVSAQGQSQELPADAGAAYQSLLAIFPELTFVQDGVTLELDGMVDINGEPAYKMNITQDGNSAVTYFSVESGLKLK